MMNLTSKTSKSFLLFKRALVLLCLVSCSLVVSANSGWNAIYNVNVQSSDQSTGSGTVYLTASAYTNGNEEQAKAGTVNLPVSVASASQEILSSDDTQKQLQLKYNQSATFYGYLRKYHSTKTRYTNVQLRAEEKPGSTFVGWEQPASSDNPIIVATEVNFQCNDNGSSPDAQTCNTVYKPIFQAKTYYRKTPELRMAIYVPAVGGETEEQWQEIDDTSIGMVRINNGDWLAKVESSITSQLGNGIDNQAEVSYTIEADPGTNYAFEGWYIHNADGNYEEVSKDSPYTSGEVSQSSKENEPYISYLDDKIIYAHFTLDRDYYHKRAKVGIALDSEIGQVYVSAEKIDNISDWQSPASGELFTSNEDANGSTTSEVVAERNALRYDYYFYAQPKDASKVAFKGWTTNADGSNITTTANPYEARFTASVEESNPHIPTTMYAVFRSYYYAKPHVIAIGGGKVSLDNNVNNAQLEIDDITSPTQVAANSTYHEYSWQIYAHAMTGTRFIGWSKSRSEKDILDEDRDIQSKTVTGRTSSMSSVQPHRVTWYAIFKSDIDIKHADRMIYYKDNQGNEYINDAKLIVDVYKASTLEVELEGPNSSLFQIMNATLTQKGNKLTVAADKGLVDLRLKYIGGTPLASAVGKNVSVKFTSKNSSGEVLTTNTHICTVEEAPVITFLPTDGRGSYTISHTDGSGISYTLDENTESSQQIIVTHENMSYLKIDMTDNTEDDRDFFGWEIVEDGQPTGEYLSYNKLFTYHFEKSITLRAEFVPQGWARYVIKSDYTANKDNPTLYYDLNDAIEQAKKGATAEDKTIVVHRNGLLPKNNYEIPAGVTLLLPYEDTYICTTGQKTQDGYDWIEPKDDDQNGIPDNLPDLQIFRKLTVEDGTKITVKEQGAICVEAKLMIFGQICIAQPYIAGHLELGDGSLIDLEDGSELFAWGYITNPENTKVDIYNMKHVGHVNVQSGAMVWEVMQFNDFRGGTAMISFVELSGLGSLAGGFVGNRFGYQHEVFPINQYYIKNVEAPLHLCKGASENLATGVYAGDAYSTTAIPFIGANLGFMTWGQSPTASLTKFYDAYTDRQIYVLEDQQNTQTSVTFGDITLSMNILSQSVDIHSKNYVMPLNNNMDIIARNAKIQLPKGINLCLLAGSSFLLDKQSIMENSAQIFVYDKDQNVFPNGSGYYGSADRSLVPIYPNHRPYGIKFSRTATALMDAHLIIDGQLNCNTGYLITTSSGANITSNGGGSISIYQFGTASTGSMGDWSSSFKRNQSIYQYDQSATSYIAIPLSTSNGQFYPKLQHGNGEYLDATEAATYYYCNGNWQKGACSGDAGYQEPFVDYTPLFNVTDPWEAEAWVSEGKQDFEVNIEETNLTNAPSAHRVYSATFSGRDANLFSFNSGTREIGFNPASIGTKKAVMILTATYTNGGNTYKHSQAISLVANAREQIANPLAFNDLTAIYVGQNTSTNLFANTGNGGDITITVKDNKDQLVELSRLGIADNIIKPTEKYNAETLTPDTFVITAQQNAIAAEHKLGATISATLIISPRVVWNWSTLYYPSADNTNPITMMDGSNGWTLTEVIDPKSGDVVKFSGTSPNYKAEIFDLINGKYKVYFRFEQQGYDPITFESNIYRDPRRLRVTVNNDTIFNAITIGVVDGVTYSDASKMVSIQSETQTINSWTVHFLGIPDALYFMPVGDKAWQIEESQDGLTWITTFSWAYITEGDYFSHSLMPSTQYVRISYAAGGTGYLRDVYITPLEAVKLNPMKLYMPAIADAKKNVAMTYVSDTEVTITDPNGEFLAWPASSAATLLNPYYKVTDIEIENQSCNIEKLTNMNIVSSSGTVQLPIQAYTYPQELPIVLASDHEERFYYVTTHNYQTTWNEDTRTITMHNAVAKAQPQVTFHYQGIPSYISFHHTPIAGNWIIEKSADGLDWSPVTTTPEISNEDFKQDINDNSAAYLRIKYDSYHAEKVEITDLRIIGEEGAFASPTDLIVKYVDENNNSNNFKITSINLEMGMTVETDNDNFKLTHGSTSEHKKSVTLTYEDYPEVFVKNKMGEIPFKVYFNGEKAVDYTTITIKENVIDSNTGQAIGGSKILATVEVTGVREKLANGDINVYTGVPETYTLNGLFEGSDHRKLDIDDAFANNAASFDYLFIFGETTTMDGTHTITTPTTLAGSNALTPCYIYQKNEGLYEYLSVVENANAATKITQDFLRLTKADAEILKVYITGFCPYASTGYTKQDEGVFFFQGDANDHIHVYLEDCYLYSRSKTENGHFFENRADGNSFTEGWVQGSGGVLVFECLNKSNANSFNVTIHTRDSNMLKSHYGCFLESVAGRAFQVSSPVQVHMHDDDFVTGSYTVLNFDDIWPIDSGEEHTNGFLSLQKQVNNAPSIDLGNDKTVVNFNGGQIELQNAQNVSDNYESTLAISHRTGKFAGFRLAYGLGSDGVGGTVNFKDGTTTVLTMEVAERYRQYYLMNEDNPATPGNEADSTSCLRTPKNTYVYGGSHCMMRACSSPTSKGGAPTDGTNALGLYKYPYTDPGDGNGELGGWTPKAGNEGTYGLVTPKEKPDDYNTNSVTPNNNNTPKDASDDFLNFWFNPNDVPSVKPEEDQKISFWRSCMTYIAASYGGYGGSVGGDVLIEMQDDKQIEMVNNLLYCEIDASILEIIRDGYSAPVKSPLPTGERYLSVKPSEIGEGLQHYILNEQPYRVENKLYYITTATADVWTSFTAPFDVEKIYIMETRHEKDLDQDARKAINSGKATDYRSAMKSEQAKHNANFAAFFGVAMAIHPNKTFDMIFSDYIEWTKTQAGEVRNKYELVHYNPNVVNASGEKTHNWDKADFYLYKNSGPWVLTTDANGQDKYQTAWDFVEPASDGHPLMEQGETYSMLFPYCTGCFDEDSEHDDGRDFWDYWTGKFLIFESTDGANNKDANGEVVGHIINGSAFVGAKATYREETEDNGRVRPIVENWNQNTDDGLIAELAQYVATQGSQAILSGNSTFAKMSTLDQHVLAYKETLAEEGFTSKSKNDKRLEIEPTVSFLYTGVDIPQGSSIKSITRTGEIIYDTSGNGTTTGGNMPTVGGGNDLFITSIAGGINIAVAAPQYVRVLSSTGALLFSGMVQTSVDVTLPANGVYVIAGENEVQKILY